MKSVASLALLVLLGSPVYSQSSSGARTLSIRSRPGTARIFESNGKAYVSLDDLARLTQGSLSFTEHQVVLSLPADQAVAPPAAVKTGFSKQFLEAGIEQMSTVREWRITIVNSIQNNSPVSEEWIAGLRRKADEKLALAAAARSTSDDRNGYVLLAGEFANMQKFSEKFLKRRRQLQYIDPKSLDYDRLDQQILACARSLSAMAADNQFREEAACTQSQ